MVLHSILYKFTIFQNFTFLSYNTSERQWFTSWAPITSWPTNDYSWLEDSWLTISTESLQLCSDTLDPLLFDWWPWRAKQGNQGDIVYHIKTAGKKSPNHQLRNNVLGNKKKRKCSKMLPGKLVDQGFR